MIIKNTILNIYVYYRLYDSRFFLFLYQNFYSSLFFIGKIKRLPLGSIIISFSIVLQTNISYTVGPCNILYLSNAGDRCDITNTAPCNNNYNMISDACRFFCIFRLTNWNQIRPDDGLKPQLHSIWTIGILCSLRYVFKNNYFSCTSS